MVIRSSSLSSRALRLTAAAGISLSVLALAGCANQSASGSVYTYGQAQQEQIVRYGTVVSVRPVVIQSDKSSGVGALAGGALGGVAGSAIGGGRGQILTSIGGALLGGLAGNAVENQVSKTQGLEITVRLDNGETRVIAQANDIALSSGQRVQVISGGGPTRVVPM
ncbi:glycine zipper 2TM domain-containing protein [Castellaniella sp.]|uniref:glycine zipper 2TM domain-containing protein n=1 Tax=Castellaniella sp. TaxID=1955812 RepID=UPI002B000184|nr:glycine zipper 2TM domain-containing protein [Castellaniella sp.]